MKNNLTHWLYKAILAILFAFGSVNSFANYIAGAYLSYKHIAGSNYKITLTVYGNCGVAGGGIFTTLPHATPQVLIYNGGTYTDSIHLSVESPDSGIDVSALCPGDSSDCVSLTSTIPGLEKFTYSATYTVPAASAAWRFIFNGYMGTAPAAGREASITNLSGPASTLFQLEDTLNNTMFNSTSPVINSVPTGFVAHQYDIYNPGAVDSDGDALTFRLAQPMNGTAASSIGSPVGYVAMMAWPGTPVSASAPIQALAGSFSMNSANGQLVFYPNVLQRSVVVYNIEAYRSGVLVGTSQMEMDFRVLTDTGATASPYISAPYVGAAGYSPSCGGVPDTVRVTAYASGCGISGFQWQSSPDNVTWTNLAGATSAIYTYTPAASLYYRCFRVNTVLGDTAYGASVYAPVSAANLMHWAIVNVGDTLCDSSLFYVSACYLSSADTVTTYFGDGTSGSTPLSLSGGVYSAYIAHWYSSPGTFPVKQVLSNGGIAIDSVTYPYNYFYCRTLQAKFYYDADSNCAYNDTIDFLNYFPLTVEIDSDGTPVDTISATSGIYYTAYGGPGTIYSFRVLSTVYGLMVSCPVGAVLSDTIQSSVSAYPVRYFALHTAPGITGFDLVNNTSLTCSPLAACGSILVYNTYPVPVSSVVSMTFSNKYVFDYSSPSPTSVAGNTATWDLGLLSSYVPMTLIDLHLAKAGVSAIPFGDTINVNSSVTPVTGDVNPANNNCAMVDTVNSAFDPNYIAVSPQGYISSGTQLQYTVHFENTGNDTAFDIYVMDTLSPSLDPHSLALIGASAPMNIWSVYNGTNEIVKFDFPHINLLDSSHHGKCDGMLVFNINVKSGLPNGTTIFNHAGIFFNDNPVVITNTVEDIIGVPAGITHIGNSSKVAVYPNPANDQLTIIADNDLYKTATITNIIGQQLIMLPLTMKQTTVNVGRLPPGMYYVALKGDSGIKVLKFEKM